MSVGSLGKGESRGQSHFSALAVSVCKCIIHAPSLGSGASVGGEEVGVVSPKSEVRVGVGLRPVEAQWKSENHTSSSAKRTSVLETTPKPDEPRPRL